MNGFSSLSALTGQGNGNKGGSDGAPRVFTRFFKRERVREVFRFSFFVSHRLLPGSKPWCVAAARRRGAAGVRNLGARGGGAGGGSELNPSHVPPPPCTKWTRRVPSNPSHVRRPRAPPQRQPPTFRPASGLLSQAGVPRSQCSIGPPRDQQSTAASSSGSSACSGELAPSRGWSACAPRASCHRPPHTSSVKWSSHV
jgi:hypothetical protein